MKIITLDDCGWRKAIHLERERIVRGGEAAKEHVPVCADSRLLGDGSLDIVHVTRSGRIVLWNSRGTTSTRSTSAEIAGVKSVCAFGRPSCMMFGAVATDGTAIFQKWRQPDLGNNLVKVSTLAPLSAVAHDEGPARADCIAGSLLSDVAAVGGRSVPPHVIDVERAKVLYQGSMPDDDEYGASADLWGSSLQFVEASPDIPQHAFDQVEKLAVDVPGARLKPAELALATQHVSQRQSSSLTGMTSSVGPSPFGRPGTVLVSAGRHRHVRLWDARSGPKPMHELIIDARDFALTCIKVHAPSLTAFVGDAAGYVSRVDLRSMRVCRAYHGAAGSVRSISVHPRLPFVAAATLDRSLRVWRADTGDLVRRVYLKQRQVFAAFEGEGVLSAHLGAEALAAARNELDYFHRAKARREADGGTGEDIGIEDGDDGGNGGATDHEVGGSAIVSKNASGEALTLSKVAGHATTASELWAVEGGAMRRHLADVAVDARRQVAMWTTPIWLREVDGSGTLFSTKKVLGQAAESAVAALGEFESVAGSAAPGVSEEGASGQEDATGGGLWDATEGSHGMSSRFGASAGGGAGSDVEGGEDAIDANTDYSEEDAGGLAVDPFDLLQMRRRVWDEGMDEGIETSEIESDDESASRAAKARSQLSAGVSHAAAEYDSDTSADSFAPGLRADADGSDQDKDEDQGGNRRRASAVSSSLLDSAAARKSLDREVTAAVRQRLKEGKVEGRARAKRAAVGGKRKGGAGSSSKRRRKE